MFILFYLLEGTEHWTNSKLIEYKVCSVGCFYVGFFFLFSSYNSQEGKKMSPLFENPSHWKM